jgi:predicted kinase
MVDMDNLWSKGQLVILLGMAAIPYFAAEFSTQKEEAEIIECAPVDNEVKEKIRTMNAFECPIMSDQVNQAANTWTALGFEEPLVIAMVGLPARGKSYISKMLMRYLKWTGFECELFNVGSYRREMGFGSADSNFFSAGNQEANKVREDLAMNVQECMYKWLKCPNGNKRRVAIFDATNTTIARRLALANKARQEGVFLLFIEVIINMLHGINVLIITNNNMTLLR